ncbi:MAG: hypothetical protein Q7T11_07815 [Deltaproteobacteria bacterium]|nr:hypothetical protein [Deltaproteobacteria bacterium]
MKNDTLIKAPSPLKVLATSLITTIWIGYGVALLQIFNRTTFNLANVILYYRGDPADENAIHLPQSFASLVSVAHVHSLSQPMMLALIGLVFAFSTATNRTKNIFIIMAFAASLVSNAAPWLIRYVSPSAVFLLPLSQAGLAVSFLVMSVIPLSDMWFRKK